MNELHYDLVVIGGGAAGLSAAVEAHKANHGSVLLIEREPRLGGILRQCIHAGFGLDRYGEDLTGPEFATRLIQEASETDIDHHLGALVTKIHPDNTLEVVSSSRGPYRVHFHKTILATGALERTRENLAVAGSRPAGVFTGGQAQQLINVYGRRIGRRVVVQGSGDIGLIITRRLMLEGYEVVGVFERLPFVAGLARNKVLCLDEFDTNVAFLTQITQIHGTERVSGVTVMRHDEKFTPLPGSECYISCDTVVFSAGLIPDRRLIPKQHTMHGYNIFPVGNAREIHATADQAAVDGADRVRRFGGTEDLAGKVFPVAESGSGVPVPSVQEPTDQDQGMLCIICPKGCVLTADSPGCDKGREYLLRQRDAQPRVLTTSTWREGVRMAARSRAAIPVLEHRKLVQRLQTRPDRQDHVFSFTEIAGTNEY